MSKIKLVYWNAPNFGDLLSPYIIKKLTLKNVEYKYKGKRWFTEYIKRLIALDFKSLKHIIKPWEKTLIAVGSVIAWGNKNSEVWGSGLLRSTENVKVGKIYAVRGKYTRDVLKSKGYIVPEVYGDPALLLPLLYKPSVPIQKGKVGIIPNWEEVDFFIKNYSNDYNIIDLRTRDIENTINNIISCEYILSTSLHGLIVAHSYGIQAIWIKKGDIQTDGIKFKDYFSSVDIDVYDPFVDFHSILEKKEDIPYFFKKNSSLALPREDVLNKVRKELLSVAPFQHKFKNN